MSDIRQVPPVAEWKARLRSAADAAYDANPGPAGLDPAVIARLRRSLFPGPPAEAEQAA